MSPLPKRKMPQRERIRPLPSFLVLIVLTTVVWGGVYVLAKHIHPHGSSACPQQCQAEDHSRPET